MQAVIALADVCLSIGMPDYTVGFLRNAAPQVRTTSGDGALSLKGWLNCLRALLGCLLAACPAGAGYHLFAGREVARALAKVAVDEKECSDK